MPDKLCILVCEDLAREVSSIVESERFDDVTVRTFEAHCDRPTAVRDALRRAIRACEGERSHIHVLGGACLASRLALPDEIEHCRVHKLGGCFNLFIGNDAIAGQLASGAYMLTPGWLARWQSCMREWGFEQETALGTTTARKFFAESAARLTLLDTGVDAASAERLAEFAGFVGRPFESVPVGLDFARLFLTRIVLEWRWENERNKSAAASASANRQLADHAMVFDLIGHLPGATTETHAIENILDLFAMLCAPTSLIYLPFIGDQPGPVRARPDSMSITPSQTRLAAFDQNYAWTDSGNGFLLRITYQAETLGVLEVEGLAFPEYKQHYLNLALTVVQVCGLAIANARSYQRQQSLIEELEEALGQRKQAEEALHVKDQAIQSSIDAIALAGLDGKLTYVNASFLKLWGYADASQVIGQPAVEFWQAPDQAFAVVQALQEHGHWIGELVARRSDNSTFDAQLSASRVADETGQPISLMASFVDISDRKQAEQELRQRNRDLDILYHAGQDLTSTLEPHEVLARLLRAITDMVGATSSSVWMRPESAESDAREPSEWICRASTHPGPKRSPVGLGLSQGQGIIGWVAQTGVGALAPAARADPRFSPRIDEQTGFETRSVLAVPLRARDQVIGVLEAVNKLNGQFSQDDLNMLEMLAVVAAIAVNNARLMETLRQRTDELQVRNQELDAFAHTVAHDLKTPLGLVIGHAEYALDDADAPAGELRQSFEAVIRNGLRMNVIIDELLLLSQVRSAEVQAEPIQMASILGNVYERLTLVIRAAQAEISAPDASAWPVVLGHAPWIEEVWANYLSNAIKHGGTPPRIELCATPLDDGRVRFWVRDRGPGIAPEDQARLFQPFTQLNQVRTKGHGLGLSIVRRIVEKLGGEVGVASEMGQGSVFSFTLPAAPIDKAVTK